MRREASRLYILLNMKCISINTYTQGSLNIPLLSNTYVGNYPLLLQASILLQNYINPLHLPRAKPN